MSERTRLLVVCGVTLGAAFVTVACALLARMLDDPWAGWGGR